MANEKVVCEICGKKKKPEKMVEYYIYKRSNHDKIMYKCKQCQEPED